ncbi:MAG: 3'(2'),5'-bisphosphate nucleotidase CysQ [Thermodesulfobacteriota bacterium]
MDDTYVFAALRACVEAGDAILKVYGSDDFAVTRKADDSPLTLADREAHRTIVARLKQTQIPLLSEEGRHTPFAERSRWERMWLVDPLDGTKEFIKRNGEFTVNIALVERGRAVFGAIFVPVRQALYFGGRDLGSFRLDDGPSISALGAGTLNHLNELIPRARRLPLQAGPASVLTVVGSRSHLTPEVEAFVENLKKTHGDVSFVAAGSSLKLCLVAEGRAMLYPRLGPTMEWDIAAGHAIAENAGARVYCHETGAPMTYNKEDLLNPWFIVEGAGYRSGVGRQ